MKYNIRIKKTTKILPSVTCLSLSFLSISSKTNHFGPSEKKIHRLKGFPNPAPLAVYFFKILHGVNIFLNSKKI